MKALLLAVAVASGFLVGAAIGMLSGEAALAWPGFSFPPDLFLLSASTAQAQWLAPGIAGALAAVLAAYGRGGGMLAVALVLSNPLVIYALLLGAGASLALAAAALLMAATLGLARQRDHRGTVGLGLAVAAAPFISTSVLVLYPALILFAPLLSPWSGPRRLAGFFTALFAPAAMAAAATLYLYWLIGQPERLAAEGPAAPLRDLLLVLAGAALVATSASFRSLLAPAGSLAAGAAALVVARLDIFNLIIGFIR